MINLKTFEKEALKELKIKILEKFPEAEIILFGSKVKRNYDEESDIDLLILIKEPVNRKIEEEITDITYDIELKYGVIFGKIIENKNFWNSKLAKVMPLHRNIEREGVKL